jgi:uncharacterized membrane protein
MATMPDEKTDVLVAGYQDIGTATADFESLVAQVKEKTVQIDGVILVTHDRKGNVSVRQTGDHLGRKGVKWGAGVGLAVGSFAPPLLVSTLATGAVAGGLIGKFVDHRVAAGIHDRIGENLPRGSAGIIAVFDDGQRLGVEQALGSALLGSIAQSDKEGVIVANADFIGGFGLWVDEHRHLNHTYSFLGVDSYRQTSTRKIPVGRVT